MMGPTIISVTGQRPSVCARVYVCVCVYGQIRYSVHFLPIAALASEQDPRDGVQVCHRFIRPRGGANSNPLD